MEKGGLSEHLVEDEVEQEMWNIFTFYTLGGNDMDPTHVNITQLMRLVKDCEMLDATLAQADVHLLFTSMVKNRQHSSPHPRQKGEKMNGGSLPDRKKLNYTEYLNCLMKIGERKYGNRGMTSNGCLECLLMDHVLPLACRRYPMSVSDDLDDEGLDQLLADFEPALLEIFRFYATNSAIPTAGHLTSSSSVCSSPSRTRQSSNMSSRAAVSLSPPRVGTREWSSNPRRRKRCTRDLNTMADSLCFKSFVHFASDAGLAGTLVSMKELVDAFLSCATFASASSDRHHETLPSFGMGLGRGKGGVREVHLSLGYDFFWELLYRTACIAYPAGNSKGEKMTMLLTYMGQVLNAKVATRVNGLKGGSYKESSRIHRGALIRGIQVFNERMVKVGWLKEAPVKDVQLQEATMILRQLAGSSPSPVIG
ncbi:unnamed protein product [Chrysoparadoxa australica]